MIAVISNFLLAVVFFVFRLERIEMWRILSHVRARLC